LRSATFTANSGLTNSTLSLYPQCDEFMKNADGPQPFGAGLPVDFMMLRVAT
jgi:hypothetical protein